MKDNNGGASVTLTKEVLRSLSRYDNRRQRREHSSIDSIVSVLTLSQWIVTYALSPTAFQNEDEKSLDNEAKTKTKTTEEETFVDSRGVRRYVSNWAAVTDDENEQNTNGEDIKKPRKGKVDICQTTGCIVKDVFCTLPSMEGLEDRHVVVPATFLNDWQRLWYSLSDDAEDAIAFHMPLFHLAVQFFFHDVTFRIVAWLFIYEMFMSSLLISIFPFPNSMAEQSAWFFTEFVKVMAYSMVFKLFKGYLPSLLPSSNNNQKAPKREITMKPQPDQSSTHLQTLPSVTEAATGGTASTTNMIDFHSASWFTLFKMLLTMMKHELRIVMKGSSSSEPDPVPNPNLNPNPTGSERTKVARDHQIKDQDKNKDKAMTFYDILNLSVKFFLKHGNLNKDYESTSSANHLQRKQQSRGKEEGWDCTSYRLVLVAVICIFPIYALLGQLEYLSGMISYCSMPENAKGNQCIFQVTDFLVNFGALVDMVLNTLVATGILTALVGIAYCGEIAFRLSDSWMEKFGCLRRLMMTDPYDPCYIVNRKKSAAAAVMSKKETESNAAAHVEMKKKEDELPLIIDIGGGSTGEEVMNILHTNIVHPNDQQNRDQEPAKTNAMQTNDSNETTRKRSKVSSFSSWFRKRRSTVKNSADETMIGPNGILKRKSVPIDPEFPPARLANVPTTSNIIDAQTASESSSPNVSMSVNQSPTWLAEQKNIISELMIKDGTEHYLFIREIMCAADRLWSPVLTALFLLAAYISVEYAAFAAFYAFQNDFLVVVRIGCFILIRLGFLVVYPILSITRANACIYQLKYCFEMATPKDYEYLDGKEGWLELMEQTPAVWTYYGIWITWDRLFGLLSTGGAGAAAYAIAMIQQYVGITSSGE